MASLPIVFGGLRGSGFFTNSLEAMTHKTADSSTPLRSGRNDAVIYVTVRLGIVEACLPGKLLAFSDDPDQRSGD
jgi:hypothetical protein